MAWVAPIVALIAGSALSSIVATLLGQWMAGQQAERAAKEMAKLYLQMAMVMIPLQMMQLMFMMLARMASPYGWWVWWW